MGFLYFVSYLASGVFSTAKCRIVNSVKCGVIIEHLGYVQRNDEVVDVDSLIRRRERIMVFVMFINGNGLKLIIIL
jgi:hypothetical protein